jgi:hypothetical protein
MAESFGILNKAYAVPKNQVLDWLNALLQVSKPLKVTLELAPSDQD